MAALTHAPQSPPKAGQSGSSPYAPDTFQTVSPALELRATEFVSQQVCERAPQEEHLGFQQPSVSLKCNPCWFSQPDVVWNPLPGPGALDCRAQC